MGFDNFHHFSVLVGFDVLLGIFVWGTISPEEATRSDEKNVSRIAIKRGMKTIVNV